MSGIAPTFEAVPTLDHLRAAARRARGRVFSVQQGGRRWVVKQAVPGRGRARAWGGALLGRILLGYWLPRTPLRIGGDRQLHYEAGRLQRLHRAGEVVPAVAQVGEGFLVLEDGGAPLWRRIRHAGLDALRPVIARVAGDLGRFHGAGHWHGGAQLRNYLLAGEGERLVRIDFEEPLDEVMPLAARQVIDLYLLIHSITAFRQLSAGETTGLCRHALEAYLAGHAPDERMVACLVRAQATLRAIERRPGRLFRHTSKDLRRLFITAAAIEQTLPRDWRP